MSQSTISVRLDSEDKKKFEEFCSKTGMNVSVAINMFIKNVNMQNKLPFVVSCDVPNETTKSAMKAAQNDEYMQGPYKSVADLMEALNA